MNITEAKAQATLKKVFRYNEGIMSRAEYMRLQKSKGAKVEMCMKSKTHYSRLRFNRMNQAEQDEYEKRLNTKAPCYELHYNAVGRGFIDITKAEYDYFKSI